MAATLDPGAPGMALLRKVRVRPWEGSRASCGVSRTRRPKERGNRAVPVPPAFSPSMEEG